MAKTIGEDGFEEYCLPDDEDIDITVSEEGLFNYDQCLYPDPIGDNDVCDLAFSGVEFLGECSLTVDSVESSGADIVVSVTTESSGVLYALVDRNGSIVRDYQLSSTFADVPSGEYFAVVTDENSCVGFVYINHDDGSSPSPSPSPA